MADTKTLRERDNGREQLILLSNRPQGYPGNPTALRVLTFEHYPRKINGTCLTCLLCSLYISHTPRPEREMNSSRLFLSITPPFILHATALQNLLPRNSKYYPKTMYAAPERFFDVRCAEVDIHHPSHARQTPRSGH